MQTSYLNYETYQQPNNQEWLIFLHGAGGSIATWKYQKEYFSKNYNLLLLDLRDHGESNVPVKESYSFNLITEDIITVLDKVGIRKAHFVTLSFGSVILQHLSMAYPDYVRSAVFAGGIFKPNIAIRLFVYLAKVVNVFLPYSWMYSIFSYLLMPRRHHQKARKIYQRQASKLSDKAYLKWVGLYQEFFELLDKFYYQNLSFPALVIMGKEDYVFLNAAKHFVSNQSKVQFHMMERAGHICNIDQPELFNQVAHNFTSSHSMKEPQFAQQHRPKK